MTSTSYAYGFFLSRGAVKLLGEIGAGHARSQLAALKRQWIRTGVLAAGAARNQALLEEMRRGGVPEQVQHMVKEFLAMPYYFAPCASVEMDVPSDGTVFVGEEDWGEGVLSEEAPVRVCASGQELCRIDCVDASRWVKAASTLTLSDETSSEVPLSALGPICGVARHLLVIDRYCGKEEIDKPGKSGLVCFLKKVADRRYWPGFDVKHLRIYTGYGMQKSNTKPGAVRGEDIEKAWRSVAPQLKDLGIERISMCVAPEGDIFFKYHDRFAVFRSRSDSEVRAVGIGAGFRIFEGKRVGTAFNVSLTDLDKARALINRIEMLCQKPEFEGQILNFTVRTDGKE